MLYILQGMELNFSGFKLKLIYESYENIYDILYYIVLLSMSLNIILFLDKYNTLNRG